MLRIRPPFPIAMVGGEAFNDIPLCLSSDSVWSISDSIFLVAAGAATLFVDATMFFFVFLPRFLFQRYKILGILQSQQAINLIIFLSNF